MDSFINAQFSSLQLNASSLTMIFGFAFIKCLFFKFEIGRFKWLN